MKRRTNVWLDMFELGGQTILVSLCAYAIVVYALSLLGIQG